MNQTNTKESPSVPTDSELDIPPQYCGASLSDHKHGETVREWMNDSLPGLLTFIGNVGTGKTRMLYAVKRMVLGKRYGIWEPPCRHYSVPDLCGFVQDWEKNSKLVLELIRYKQILLLDDLGVEKTTEFLFQELGRLISGREEWDLPTLITTNLQLDPPQISARYGERVASRIASGRVLLFEGKDHRIPGDSHVQKL